MKKFFIFLLGHGSNIIFVLGAWIILMVQPDFETGNTYYNISIYLSFYFLFSQAILVQVLKGQSESEGMLDLILSFIVVLCLILIAIFSNRDVLIWWDIYVIYLAVGIYDLIFNNRLILQKFRMSTGFAKED